MGQSGHRMLRDRLTRFAGSIMKGRKPRCASAPAGSSSIAMALFGLAPWGMACGACRTRTESAASRSLSLARRRKCLPRRMDCRARLCAQSSRIGKAITLAGRTLVSIVTGEVRFKP